MTREPPEDALEVAPGVRIPMHEIAVSAISGSGPGGQHVNRSATRIALQWNVRNTEALRADQRERVLTRLSSRVDREGSVRIVAGEFRSQQQNRRAALERLQQLIARALIVPRTRKATKPTRGSVEQRLTSKKRHGERKQQRRADYHD